MHYSFYSFTYVYVTYFNAAHVIQSSKIRLIDVEGYEEDLFF